MPGRLVKKSGSQTSWDLTQHFYDLGTLPSSANECVLGKVYLRSNLSKETSWEEEARRQSRNSNFESTVWEHAAQELAQETCWPKP